MNVSKLKEIIAELDAEIERLEFEEGLNYRTTHLPDDIRGHLLRLGASIEDYVLWVRRRAQPSDTGNKPEDQKWYAEEMEAGSGEWGSTPREAIDCYFRPERYS